jgi:O-antigen/teichoic acid export membrane protein
LPKIVSHYPDSFLGMNYVTDYQIGYIFMANIIASFLTFLALSNNYLALKWKFNFVLWKNDAVWLPIMIAGIAFAINEQFDKILLGACCR